MWKGKEKKPCIIFGGEINVDYVNPAHSLLTRAFTLFYHTPFLLVINPRRTCAARVTVLSLCVSLCPLVLI